MAQSVVGSGGTKWSKVEGGEPISKIEMPRGRFSARLDDKGRLKVPSELVQYFNSLPERKLFLTSLDRRTAQIYPIGVWRANENVYEMYREKPAAARIVMFNAQDLGADVEMDGQGRITIHTDLRRTLGMEGQDLHLLPLKTRVDILPDPIYQVRRREAEELAAASLEEMGKAGWQ